LQPIIAAGPTVAGPRPAFRPAGGRRGRPPGPDPEGAGQGGCGL